jgi:hypothetical protein
MSSDAIASERRGWISNIHREVTYPHSRAKVWRALTDPDLIGRWLMKPEGFEPVVGTRFIPAPRALSAAGGASSSARCSPSSRAAYSATPGSATRIIRRSP